MTEMAATPPKTPPTIGPTAVELEEEVEVVALLKSASAELPVVGDKLV